MLLCSLCRSPEAQKVSLGLPVGNCLASAQSRAKAVQDLDCGSECAKQRAGAVLDLSQPRKRPACLDLGGGKFSRVCSGAFSSGLSFHPGGFSLVPGFRAFLPGQSSRAAASVVRSASPLSGPAGSVGVVGCVPGPVAPPPSGACCGVCWSPGYPCSVCLSYGRDKGDYLPCLGPCHCPASSEAHA